MQKHPYFRQRGPCWCHKHSICLLPQAELLRFLFSLSDWCEVDTAPGRKGYSEPAMSPALPSPWDCALSPDSAEVPGSPWENWAREAVSLWQSRSVRLNVSYGPNTVSSHGENLKQNVLLAFLIIKTPLCKVSWIEARRRKVFCLSKIFSLWFFPGVSKKERELKILKNKHSGQ